jgi:hypothetical protein
MPTATTTSTNPNKSHDAPRAPVESHESTAVEVPPQHEEPLDVATPDPYDNVACTD